MKFKTTMLLMLALWSCSEEECKTCFATSENNLTHAHLACDGASNLHPLFEETANLPLGELCEEEIQEVMSTTMEINFHLCSGIIGTRRTRIVCN